ncbi:MAG: hypothetical protein KKI08_14275 [Armatimonadetes bacterium]|nr:hypothetical protein [Armatimonadota bacterium]
MRDTEARKANPQQITFLPMESPQYRLVPISGVFGGLTLGGMVWADLFFEHGPMPKTITHEITSQGIGKETARTGIDLGHPCVERRSEIGVVMSLDTARVVAKWLTEKIKEAESIEAQKGAK